MTRSSAGSSLPGRPNASQRVLCSTSGNAYHNSHEQFNFENNEVGQSFAAPLVSSRSRNGNNLAQIQIVDSKGHRRHVWKKTPGSEGVPHQFMQYLEEIIVTDEHNNKHKVWERSGLLTNAELQSEKYKTYRARTQKCLGKDGLPVWPDYLEEVFQYLIRKIPSMGKKKVPYPAKGGKSCGRNEIISGEIKVLTNMVRLRKQVSSHFQVLKNMFPEGSAWLQLVTYDEKAISEKGASHFDTVKGEVVFSRLSSAPNRNVTKEEEFDFNSFVVTPVNSYSNRNCSIRPSVQRIEFDMRIHAAYGMDIIHSYTTIQSEIGASRRCLEDVVDWRLIYPDLTKIHREEGLMNDEIILLETNFELMDGFPPVSSKLGIQLFVEMTCDPDYSEWMYNSRFYEQGEFKLERSYPLKTSHIFHTNRTKIEEIPLESSWWINVFHKIAQRHQEVVAKKDAQAIRQEEEDARRYLREVSVMQEILATSASDRQQKRVAILLWKFRQTRGEEAATTTWRRIEPPPSNGIVNSPRPPKPQPPLSLDETMLYNHDMPSHQYPAPPEMTSFLDPFPKIQDTKASFEFELKMKNTAGDYYRLASVTVPPANDHCYIPVASFSNVQESGPVNRCIDVLEDAIELENSPQTSGCTQPFKELGTENSHAVETSQTTMQFLHTEDEDESVYKFQVAQFTPEWPQIHSAPLNIEELDSLRNINHAIEEFQDQDSSLDFNAQTCDQLAHGSFMNHTSDTYPDTEFDSQCTTTYTSTNSAGYTTDQSTCEPSYADDFYGGEIQLRLGAQQPDDISVFDPAILDPMKDMQDQAYSSQEYSSQRYPNQNHNRDPYAPHQPMPNSADLHLNYPQPHLLLPSSVVDDSIPTVEYASHHNHNHSHHPNTPSTLSPVSCDTPWQSHFPPEFFADLRFERPGLPEDGGGRRAEETSFMDEEIEVEVMQWDMDHVPRWVAIDMNMDTGDGVGHGHGHGIDNGGGSAGGEGVGRILGEVVDSREGEFGG